MYVEIHFLIISRVLEWNYLIRGLESETNSKKKLVPVKNCRSIGKKDMLYNDLTPNIEINPAITHGISDYVGSLQPGN